MWIRKHVLVVSVAALMVMAIPAGASQTAPGLPVMYGLGDSWAAGEGTADPATQGYVSLVHQTLRTELACTPGLGRAGAAGCRQLALVNLGRSADPSRGLPGVRISALISEQLPGAIADIDARNSDRNPLNDVQTVVITVGGNDGSDALGQCGSGLTVACVNALNSAANHVLAKYREILSALRAVAPDATIVVTTYDNPIPFCVASGIPGAEALALIGLEGFPGLVPLGLNDAIRLAASDFGAQVADVFGQLASANFWVGGADCLHPSTAGHAVIAALVEEAILG